MSRRPNEQRNDISEIRFPSSDGTSTASSGGQGSMTHAELQARMGVNEQGLPNQMWSTGSRSTRADRGLAADQYGDDLGQDFGDQGLNQGQDQDWESWNQDWINEGFD
jgi:hypothetical protein